jgi:hypothetical protein
MNLKNLFGYLTFAFILVLGSTFIVYPAITQISGLAVAQSSTRWNNVQDAAAGDNLTTGVMAMSLYTFDGTNFDRARGTTTNGIDVDVTRIASNDGVDIGDVTINNLVGSAVFARITDGVETAAVSAGLALLTDSSATTQPISGTVTTTPPTAGAAFFAIKDTAITTASQNFAFGFTSEKVAIVADQTNTAELCVDWLGGTAVCPATDVAGDDRLAAGEIIFIDDYAQTSIAVIAASGTQTVFIRAWN